MTKILKGFVALTIFILPFFAAVSVDAQRFIGSSIQYGSGADQCPSGYELLEILDNPYQSVDSPEYGVGGIQVGGGTQVVCQKMDLCDEYGNAWPQVGVDTETDARFSLCTEGIQRNIVTATLTAAPASVYSGEESILQWGSANATSCSGAGFLTGGATSGSVAVNPSITTNYSVTCTGSTGSAIASAEVAVTGEIDLVPSRPSLNSGSLIGEGKLVTFKSLISNIGIGNINDSIPTRFELDTNNDGTYDVTLPSGSIAGLNSGESENIVSSTWTSVLGTHAVRAVVDSGGVTTVSQGRNGCYTATGAGGEPIQVCPDALPFVNGCASINYDSFSSRIFSTSEPLFDICLGDINDASSQGIIVFEGTEKKDLFARYGALIDADLRENGGVRRGSASIYTGKKTGGGSATLDRICKLIDPESTITGFKSRKYDSPGNNSIILWNGSSWEKHGAKNYNSHVSGTITCTKYPPETPATVITPGEFVEENESNNYSPNFVFTVRVAQCSDGIDNDGDGLIDLLDEDCSSEDDNSERSGDDGSGDGSEEGALVEPVVEITASATLVREGDQVTISWIASDVESCTVAGPSLSRFYSDAQISDQVDSEIEFKSTYSISCETAVGTVTDSVTVTVVPTFTEE